MQPALSQLERIALQFCESCSVSCQFICHLSQQCSLCNCSTLGSFACICTSRIYCSPDYVLCWHLWYSCLWAGGCKIRQDHYYLSIMIGSCISKWASIVIFASVEILQEGVEVWRECIHCWSVFTDKQPCFPLTSDFPSKVQSCQAALPCFWAPSRVLFSLQLWPLVSFAVSAE